ncbi:MAG: TIGR04211 family SH3 domain-containing protein [Moritella sp.]|uniref:TIGR04211 family SH3 domain-containing protein n=1 Tax=Moritella sp. TaxID=78556 RepID=UPI0025E93717|nr:TIGR04211 family SH3 domain-containing protein [Moritella sp.]NQZ93831.1 TIGR04211 family SH3 domain-containing protein [Moritella sp.]
MKIKQLIIATLLTLVSVSSFAKETRYISDDVAIYMHSGPGTQYRIIGTVKAGEAVTYLQTNAGSNFTQIITSKDKTAWIDGNSLSRQVSLKIRTPKLQAELAKTKAALAKINSKNTAAIAQLTDANRDELAEKEAGIAAQANNIASLTAENSALTEEAVRLREENEQLSTRLDTKEEDEQHRFIILGALILAAGLIAGLIIPSIRFRRKKNNGWD